VRHSAVALREAQVNSSSAQSELSLAHSNLRHHGSFARNPTGLTMQVSTSLRPLWGILAESTGLIAKKGPPRLFWLSAWCRQVARYCGLRNAETEHQKLAMDPWRTPEKVLTGHLCYQKANFTGDPRAPTALDARLS